MHFTTKREKQLADDVMELVQEIEDCQGTVKSSIKERAEEVRSLPVIDGLPKPSGGPVRKLPGIPGGPPIIRDDIPVIPPIQPSQPLDPNPVVAQCGACGLELHRVMH